MRTLFRWAVGQPVVTGNIVKVLLGAAAAFGLAVTDAQTEAIVAAAVAVVAAVAAITGVEQARVTPVDKVASLLNRPVAEANDLLRGVGKVLRPPK